MKTSFSVKVTGSITISIESSNEDGGGAAGDVDDVGNILVDALLKSLVNDAIKKYAGDNGTTVDVTSPLPHRRIPADADDEEDDDATTDDGKADDADDDDDDSTDDGEAKDEATDLPTVQVDIDNEYEEDYHLSQKMHMMSLRSPNLLE